MNIDILAPTLRDAVSAHVDMHEEKILARLGAERPAFAEPIGMIVWLEPATGRRPPVFACTCATISTMIKFATTLRDSEKVRTLRNLRSEQWPVLTVTALGVFLNVLDHPATA